MRLPADVKYTYVVLIIIGGIAGFLAGVFFGITALSARFPARQCRRARR